VTSVQVVTEASTAVLFPGQGSHTPAMRELVCTARPDLLELAIELAGADPFERIADGTRFQQPAVFCASLASWSQLADLEPAALAGHSLGEITALVAAGALQEADGLRLVVTRARLMQEAGDRQRGGMIAVRGARAEIEPLVQSTGAVIANDNAPTQVVLSGPEAALERAQVKLGRAGLRVRRLDVSAAFHSPVMAPAADGFARAVFQTPFAPMRIPVFSCSLAAVAADPRRALVDGLTAPVRWVETLRALHDHGVQRFIETGPGSVLCGLVRRTIPDAEVRSLSAAR
jgi:[acyl-carrier-protein] S-malonyltransferase